MVLIKSIRQCSLWRHTPRWARFPFAEAVNIYSALFNLLLAPIAVGSTPFGRNGKFIKWRQKSKFRSMAANGVNDDSLLAFEQCRLIRTRRMDICAVTFYNRIYKFWGKRSRYEWICVAYLLRIHGSVEIPFSTKAFLQTLKRELCRWTERIARLPFKARGVP